MELIAIAFYIVVLIFSVIVHEVSHGAVADYLGDPTARLEGRLTLNPVSHIDPFGSVVLPLVMYVSTGTVFGWAKPVPYNPHNLKNPKTGAALIAAAGPASNLLLAIVFGLILKSTSAFGISPTLAQAFATIVYTNVLLAIFNLVPIPPLDGSKLLFAFLPNTMTGLKVQEILERFGIVLLLVFILWGFPLLSPIVQRIFYILAG